MSQCSTNTTTIPKTNINSTISTSTFSATTENTIIKEVTLTELQNAISKLNTYLSKVSNCGNCKQFNLTSTGCQITNTSTKKYTKTSTTTTTVYHQCTYCKYGDNSYDCDTCSPSF